MSVLLEQPIKSLLLTDSELPRLNPRVVNTEERIDIVHGLGTDVGELLDLGRNVLDLTNIISPSYTMEMRWKMYLVVRQD